MLMLVPQTAEVFVASAELKRSATGSITGPLWLRLPVTGELTAADAFPGDGWSDFPVVVLEWWLSRLARDTGGREALEHCEFMDGPFAFTVRRRGDPLWIVAAPGHGEVLVDGHTFLNNVTEAAGAVLDACYKHAWHGRDADALARAIEQADSYRAA